MKRAQTVLVLVAALVLGGTGTAMADPGNPPDLPPPADTVLSLVGGPGTCCQ